MSDYSNIVKSLFTDSKSLIKSYLAFKKNTNEIKKIAFSFEEIPFKGNFAVLAGVDEIINFLKNFKFTKDDISFLKDKFKNFNEEYFEFLENIGLEDIYLSGLENGSEFFVKEKVLILQGKLPVIILLTYAISNLISFSTLVCTNSMRMRKIAGEDISMLEFGLRRAQGPMAGSFASKYAYLGSFSAVSNCLAGMYFDIPVKGTCAHAYIMSYQNQQIENEFYLDNDPKKNLYQKALEYRTELNWHTNLDELRAFCSFARIYKENSLLLVDTYNTIHSGVKNSILVSLALNFYYPGVNIRGVRLDSGDLADLSKKSKVLMDEIADKYGNTGLKELKISASNDINENSLKKFNNQGHNLHILGIGTNLVTCQLQPFCYVKNEIRNESYEENICSFINKDNKKLEKRVVIENLNSKSKKEFEEFSKQTLNESEDNLEIRSKFTNLFENRKAVNQKSLQVSKINSTENYFQISHIIKLDENSLPKELEYIHKAI